MAATENKIYAPKIASNVLWQMNEKDFNTWREKNDYPRIIQFLKYKLSGFTTWMEDQEITEDFLIKYSPSTFLRNQSSLYLYEVIHDEKDEKEILSENRYAVGSTFFHLNFIKKRKNIIPYPIWYFQKNYKSAPEISITLTQGRSHFIFSELELLDLGNCHLVNNIIGDRHLDFTNLDNLRITDCFNNTFLKIWFCSAINITIEGDLAFINAYASRFYQVRNNKSTNLKLSNGNFQSWDLVDCDLNLAATNAVIHLWKFTGWDFTATLNNSDIRECSFKSSKIRYPIDFGRAKNFHAHVKRLYSQLGKKKQASDHYYLEKKYERISFLHVKENFQNRYYQAKRKIAKLILKINFLLRYIYSSFLNILWGYGERPARIFGISLITILIFTFVFCYSPQASLTTKHHFTTSLYFSIVTFTTLGYGDINQQSNLLRLLSGFEALLGMSFWGTLIAGFTSNAKDY
jgi:ion channel